MAPAAGFTEVLDQVVDRYESEEPAAARRCHPGIATRGVFWFEGLESRFPLVRAARPSRPRRSLTTDQQRALDHLNDLGAALRADFTRAELRSAFRSLARAYHPDHHPGRTAGEKARLSYAFGALRRAYDHLKAAA